jgi:hypothetical protein
VSLDLAPIAARGFCFYVVAVDFYMAKNSFKKLLPTQGWKECVFSDMDRVLLDCDHRFGDWSNQPNRVLTFFPGFLPLSWKSSSKGTIWSHSCNE